MKKVLITFLAISISACNLFFIPSEEDIQKSIDSKIVQASNKLGFKVLKDIQRFGIRENVLFSPYSLTSTLSILHRAAEADTKETLEKVLSMSSDNLQQLNSYNNTILRLLENQDNQAKIKINTSIWFDKQVYIRDEYRNEIKDNYYSKIEQIDTSLPDPNLLINQWITENSSGNLPSLRKKIQPNSLINLINFSTFESFWSEEFDQNNIKLEPFRLLSNNQIPLPFLAKDLKLQDGMYSQNQSFEAVKIPFSERKLSAIFIIPNASSNIEEVVASLENSWDSIISQLRQANGSISIPKFRITKEMDLNQILKNLNLGVLFNKNPNCGSNSGRANFTNMIDKSRGACNVNVGEIIQKTSLAINETGFPKQNNNDDNFFVPPAQFQIKVNRPFFMAIVDNRTNLIAELAVIVDPTK